MPCSTCHVHKYKSASHASLRVQVAHETIGRAKLLSFCFFCTLLFILCLLLFLSQSCCDWWLRVQRGFFIIFIFSFCFFSPVQTMTS